MSSVILTVSDPWKANTEKLSNMVPKLSAAAYDPASHTSNTAVITFEPSGPGIVNGVRRPLSGISIKPNTSAFVQVINSRGDVLSVFNELGGTRPPVSRDSTGKVLTKENEGPLDKFWTDWLLQSVTEVREEKYQLTETFGKPILYVFGERPRFLQFQGYLVNTADFNWRAEFWENWEKYFRGTRLVENDALMWIGFDDILVGGYPLQAQAPQTASEPHIIPFSFGFYVVSYTNLYMKNVASIQKLRNDPTARFIIDRSSEYASSGVFGDPSLRLGASGELDSIIGGERLRFAQFLKNKLGYTESDQQSIKNTMSSLFGPDTTYIKGAKTAIEALAAYRNRNMLDAAYAGVDALGKVTPGGVQHLNFFFGLAGHLYKSIALNALKGVRSDQANIWTSTIDNMAQIGNAYGIAAQMGFAVGEGINKTLYSKTDKYELSNQEINKKTGKIQAKTPSLGNTLASDNSLQHFEPEDNSDGFDMKSAPLSMAGSGTSSISGMSDSKLSPSKLTMSKAALLTKQKTKEQELHAINAQKASKSSPKYGAMSIIDSEEDVNDDGID